MTTKIQSNDPLLCCLNDSSGCKNSSSSPFQGKCSKAYTSSASTQCRALLTDYCTGNGKYTTSSSSDWINRWNGNVKFIDEKNNLYNFNSPCYNLINRNLYDNTVNMCMPQGVIDPSIIDTSGYNYD
mgnify:CR=1 FL=1